MTHLAVAVLTAGAATGVTLGLDRPASPASASAAAALPGSSAVPAPAASPAAGGGTGNAEQQVVNKVEPGLVVINTTMQYTGEAGAGTGMVINPDGLVLPTTTSSRTPPRSPRPWQSPARPTRPP
jgi:hypothetical protein